MKPSRKVSRRSFITLVSGHASTAAGLKGLGSRGEAVETDHDLALPGAKGGGGGGGDPDSEPH